MGRGRYRALIILLTTVVVMLVMVSAAVRAHGGGGGDDDGDEEEAGGGDHGDLRKDKKLVAVKLWCLAIVFLATFLGGMSPLFCRWNHDFLLLGTQFAGGVFLATALLHFLSDSNSTFQDLAPRFDYPLAFALAAAGYLLTMLADCLLHVVLHRQDPSDLQTIPRPSAAITDDGMLDNHNPSSKHHDVAINVNAEAKFFLSATTLQNTTVSDTLLLIIALCFHSVFEGIAIGIAENAEDAWRALWTISLHKVFAAIAMGLALLSMVPNRPLLSCALFSFAFAISSPIGVAIGITIDSTTEGDAADWTYAIAMGIACGVFIYVSINHLLAKGFLHLEKLRFDTPIYKLLATTLGVGVIAVVMIWD